METKSRNNEIERKENISWYVLEDKAVACVFVQWT